MRPLTVRQRQVLLLVASGCTGEQIGQQLGIASTTVTRHLTEVYRALGAKERAHAVSLGIHYGHITLAELARIAAASSVQGGEGPWGGVGRPQSAPEAFGGPRDVRDAPRPTQRRTAPRGEVAA